MDDNSTVAFLQVFANPALPSAGALAAGPGSQENTNTIARSLPMKSPLDVGPAGISLAIMIPCLAARPVRNPPRNRPLSFPHPTHDAQPRRYFTAGKGVGVFVDPATGRYNVACIYENSAQLYPMFRHHNVRVTATRLADRTVYRAAMFLLEEPTRAANKGGPPGYASDVQAREEDQEAKVVGASRGAARAVSANGDVEMSDADKTTLSDKGKGDATAAEPTGSVRAKGDASDAVVGDAHYLGFGFRQSVAVPEFVQRLALVGPPAGSLDVAVEGLARVAYRARVEMEEQ